MELGERFPERVTVTTAPVPPSHLNDGDPVTTWLDSSGNGHNATQTGTARPIFKKNIINGKPAVRFTAAGLSRLNVSPVVSSLSPWSGFVVMAPAVVGSTAVSLANSLASGPAVFTYYGTTPTYYVMNRTQLLQSTGAFPVTGFHVFRTDSGLSIAMDGQPPAGQISPNVVSGDFDTIGAWLSIPAYSDADIAEIIFYNVLLAATDIHNIEAGLGAKYGISITAAGSAVDPSTVAGLQAWWKADSLL